MTNDSVSVPMGDFPPYGFLNAVERLDPGSPLFPPDFHGNAEDWDKWFKATLDLINRIVWPRFDRANLSWVGPSSAFMLELTLSDLGIIDSLRTNKPFEFDRQTTTAAGALQRSTHRTLYHAEDGFIEKWGMTYQDDYDLALAARLSGNFVPMIKHGVNSKVADTDVRFKLFLQRPRPYQTAFILGHKGFDYEEGVTANTPSMCCGHCMEGLLGIGSIMEQIILGGLKLSEESWAALEQFSVDIGDRRVMAGVHYPSDALCSWLICMLLAPHIFRTDAVKPHLWNAIKKRSYIYRMIDNTIRSGKGKVYESAMAALAGAAE